MTTSQQDTPTPPGDTPAELRVGIVGTGGISRAHAPGWVEAGAQLHCYSLEGAEDFARTYGATVHDSYDSLLEAVHLVDICTPTPVHAEQVHAALDAGKDVICEKPLALTGEDARAVVEHAETVGRQVFPAHVVRFFPQYAAAHAAVTSGAIGTPAVLRFERTGSLPTQSWFGDESQSGGIVMDQMIHDIDQAIWLAGPVERVYATQATAASDESVRTGHAVLTHRSGVISHCRGFWGPQGTVFRYAFDLAGDAGRLRYDSAGDPEVVLDEVASARSEESASYLPDVSAMRSPYAEEILEFSAALRSGTSARVTALDGAYAVEVAAAALESLRTGRSISC